MPSACTAVVSGLSRQHTPCSCNGISWVLCSALASNPAFVGRPLMALKAVVNNVTAWTTVPHCEARVCVCRTNLKH